MQRLASTLLCCLLAVLLSTAKAEDTNVAITLRCPDLSSRLDAKTVGKQIDFRLSVTILNRGPKAHRFTIFESWRLLVVDDHAQTIPLGLMRDWLRAFAPTEWPMLKPGKSYKFTIHCRLSRNESGWTLFVSDEVGGNYIAECRPCLYKVCLEYYASPENPIFNGGSRYFGWNIKELWRGVAISSWKDLDFRKLEEPK